MDFEARRLKLGLSRTALAFLSELTETTIYRLETDRKTSQRVKRQIDGLLYLFERDKKLINVLMERKNQCN